MGLPAKWRDAGRSGLISRADVRCVMGRIRNVARAGQYMYDSSEQKDHLVIACCSGLICCVSGFNHEWSFKHLDLQAFRMSFVEVATYPVNRSCHESRTDNGASRGPRAVSPLQCRAQTFRSCRRPWTWPLRIGH